jgi:hypothetical protein
MRKLLLILLVVAVTGCSTTRLAYNRLDWIAGWQISSYLALDDAQKTLFDSEFAALWHWHRQGELPQYATDLESLAAAIEGDHFDRATLDDSVRTANAHAARLYQRALPPAAKLIATLSDEQLVALRKRVREDADKGIERYRKRGTDGWRDKAASDMQRSLRRWIGRVTPQQRARIDQWAQARQATPELWFEYQQAWTEDFFVLLEDRGATDFPDRLRDRLEGRDGFRSEALSAAAQADRELWMQLMMDLHALLQPRQRERMLRELRSLAADFTSLAAEAGPQG